MPPPRSLPVALGLTVLSAGLLALALPPWDLWPLAYVCLVPYLLALRSGGLRRALLLGWVWGSVLPWAIASEFPASIAAFYQRPAWFGALAGHLLFTVMGTVYCMAFAVLHHFLPRRPHVATPLLVAAAWVTVELARGRLLTGTRFFIGNPWGLLGYTHASGALAQTAAVAGVYGISFALAAVNAGIASWLAARQADANEPAVARRTARRSLALALAPALGAGLAGGVALLAAPSVREDHADFRQVAVAQGNVAVGRRWRSDYYAKNLDVYLDLTRRALERGAPKTVIWPEAAFNFFLEREPGFARRIAQTLRSGGDVELLAGGPSSGGDGEPPYYNSMFLLGGAGADGEGTVRARYDKEYLVPFSEYFPFERLDFMRRGLDGPRTFTPGPRSAPLATALGRAGLLVCVEAMLPEVAAARVRDGAELLVSPSHDGWIADARFGEHMLAMVGLRAIEQRRYLVRASTSGPSAVVDPWGRVLVRSAAFSRHVILGRVRPLQGRSVYGHLGDAFGLACVAGTLAALFRARSGPAAPQGV